VDQEAAPEKMDTPPSKAIMVEWVADMVAAVVVCLINSVILYLREPTVLFVL
jgi:hypothetical protein